MMKKTIITGCILFHFTVVILGMVNPEVEGFKPFWSAVNFYGKSTGASASYHFFSPDIPLEMIFQFTVHEKDRVFDTTLRDTANNEVNARIGNILRTIPHSFENKKIVRSLSASVTASMFKLYPQAERIEFKSLFFVLPSMDQYREGQRIRLEKVYSAIYGRNTGS